MTTDKMTGRALKEIQKKLYLAWTSDTADRRPDDMEMSRVFDEIAILAGMLSAQAAHRGAGPETCQKIVGKRRKAIRKALGYTTP